MNRLRALMLSATTILVLVATTLPALATEGGGDEVKSQLITRSLHHKVGAVILAVASLLVLMALINAVQQLRGTRGQADGKFRWR